MQPMLDNKHKTMVSYHPELDEILQWREGNVETIWQRVEEEEKEELVVWKTHAVVYPAHNSHINKY